MSFLTFFLADFFFRLLLVSWPSDFTTRNCIVLFYLLLHLPHLYVVTILTASSTTTSIRSFTSRFRLDCPDSNTISPFLPDDSPGKLHFCWYYAQLHYICNSSVLNMNTKYKQCILLNSDVISYCYLFNTIWQYSTQSIE